MRGSYYTRTSQLGDAGLAGSVLAKDPLSDYLFSHAFDYCSNSLRCHLTIRVGYLSLLLAVLFFFHGFSLKTDLKSKSLRASSSQFKECFDGEATDHLVDGGLRVVLMVIDACRLSFLTDVDSPMTFLRRSIMSGRAVAFMANSQTPTVTMPRIKALTSGVIPSLISLLANFFASEGTEDSWVTSAASEGRRIKFFGDDTWLRLFPKAFSEADGVTSFYVNDFTEVDNNVTRHLETVLNEDTWDALVLHYLGLDHIGHSLGGQSSQLKVKLREMDDFFCYKSSTGPGSYSLHRRHTPLQMVTGPLIVARSPVLMIVVADHGMTNAGSHGGGSEAEVRVPMLFLHSKTKVIRAGNMHDFQPAEQVDLATTLPFFFRTSIPLGSVGLSLIPQLARHWQLNSSNIVSAAHQDAVHLSFLLDDDSLSHLTQLDETDRCQAARTFALHAKGRLALEETRRVQRKLIQSQEQAFRWPIFVGLALAVVSFIAFFGCHPFNWRGASAVRRGSRFRDGLVLLCLHRFATSFTAHTRRRWSMKPDILPPPILPEFRFDVKFLDALTTQLNMLTVAKRAPAVVTVLCTAYFLLRLRPKRTGNTILVALPYLSSAAVCLRAFLGDDDGLLVLPIVAGALLTSLTSVTLGGLIYMCYLVRPEALPLLVISCEMGIRARRMHASPYLFTFLCQTVFFYTGQSSNISSIDIAVGYKGLSSYIAPLVGAQILTNFYSMPLSFALGYFFNHVEQADALDCLGSLLQLRSLTLFSSIVSMICLSGHLFTFSVLAPKMICEILHAIIALIIASFALLFMCGARVSAQ
ncbi:unnamed protein product [Heligmosomoides polygyrus]|uniref:PIGO_PIGG domain-containing protein n=1 Tax=Heligmosomoides polygyrus TaxID=6339 RepID=A0A3P7YQ29_HELPZ|nr:unnamed protein product [Heligmosomoides polygyrus]